jgi:hypothetical protein
MNIAMKTKHFNVDRQVAVFFAITVVSVGFLVEPLWSYAKFYDALWNFDYKPLNLTVDTNQMVNSYARINIELRLANPIDYSGLKVSSIVLGLEYIGAPHLVRNPAFHIWGSGPQEAYIWTNVWDLKVETFHLNLPIAPGTNSTVTLTCIIDPIGDIEPAKTNGFDLLGFLSGHPEQVEWLLECRLFLSSFMGGFEVNRDFTYTTTITYS